MRRHGARAGSLPRARRDPLLTLRCVLVRIPRTEGPIGVSFVGESIVDRHHHVRPLLRGSPLVHLIVASAVA